MGMKQHEFGVEDHYVILEGTVPEVAEMLQVRLEPGEFYKKGFLIEASTLSKMQRYVDALKEAGLDIGKGDATFGYRMPLPDKNVGHRDLIIFRRK